MRKVLSFNERLFIQQALERGIKGWRIAQILKRQSSCIYTEIKRNGGIKHYCARTGQERFNRLKHQERRKRMTLDMKELIEEKMRLGWSFQQIEGYCIKHNIDMISFKTMYRLFHQKKILQGDRQYLRRKGKARKKKQCIRFKKGKSIKERQVEANDRQEIGHWEIDTVLSNRESKKVIVTCVDRYSRYLVAGFSINKTSENVSDKIVELLKDYPVKTITSDNGVEFADFKSIEKRLKTDFYFAESFKSWQRGSNENANGLLREYFEKGTSFEHRTDEELESAVKLINERPAKILDWKTRQQVFYEAIQKVKMK